ncbi:LytTR family DNA-binding domain-containing protein [Catenovulum adriaticum]|uniref:LytTR family transcriptional regulator n=1 Tax=Catenovulum adriaticum TaxID=2984846 RepID=A0ABY7AS22_9ALTE|nr:LytTR family DNA-binding domain-containing protein [Catenovulum sp. TS8]WAJ72279.1 LytTR family transcriptional regulator [Catenovulum sp. TS8]
MLVSDTVLGRAPLKSGFALTALGLTILFTLMEPESSDGLDFFQRLLFWFLQITAALLGLMFASYVTTKMPQKHFPLYFLLLVSGLLGAVLVSPIFASIDYWFPGLEDEPDSRIDMLDQQGPIYRVISEFLEVTPGIITIWFLINIPLLLNVTYKLPTEKNNPPPQNNPRQTENELEIEKLKKLRTEFYDRLPVALGLDIISISSELHYVNVKMTKGNTLILGALNQIAEVLDDEGVLIHRSHWVHKNHVFRVHISGNKAWCEMSNGARLPISRSKRKLVKSYFGRGNS